MAFLPIGVAKAVGGIGDGDELGVGQGFHGGPGDLDGHGAILVPVDDENKAAIGGQLGPNLQIPAVDGIGAPGGCPPSRTPQARPPACGRRRVGCGSPPCLDGR